MLKGCVRGGSGWSCVGFFRRAYGVDPYIEKLKNKARKRTNWNRPASHKYDLEEAWDVIAGQLNSAVTVPVPVEIQQFQSVGIVGLPNAGKSTLVNAILRDKVSIPSRKRHTTRRQVLGVLTEGKYQVEICDVPGFLSHGIGKEEVGLERKYLAEEAWSVVESADKVVFVVDAAVSNMAKERTTRNTLIRAGKAGNMPILVMNKVDLARQADVMHKTEEFMRICNFEQIFFTEAVQGYGVEPLRKHLLKTCKKLPWEYTPGTVHVDSLKDKVRDIIFMELLDKTHDRIPYHVQIVIDKIIEMKEGKVIVVCEFFCQPGAREDMIIGTNGEILYNIVCDAEIKISELMRKPVMVRIHVHSRTRPERAQGDFGFGPSRI